MLTMNEFYKQLSTTSTRSSRYLDVFRRLTKISRTRLLALVSDLGWQAW